MYQRCMKRCHGVRMQKKKEGECYFEGMLNDNNERQPVIVDCLGRGRVKSVNVVE